MKYIILKGAPLFDTLRQLRQRMIDCQAEASKIVEELGGLQWTPRLMTIAGGISAIQFDKPPMGWKRVYKEDYQDVYFPKRNMIANRDILQRIDKLPFVTFEELNKYLNFEGYQTVGPADHGPGQKMILHPLVTWRDDYVLVSVHEKCKYAPLDGMKEITVSEYHRMKGEAKAEEVE